MGLFSGLDGVKWNPFEDPDPKGDIQGGLGRLGLGGDGEDGGKRRNRPLNNYKNLSDQDLARELGGIDSAISRATLGGNTRAQTNLENLKKKVLGLFDDPSYDWQHDQNYKPIDFSGTGWTLSEANNLASYYNDARGLAKPFGAPIRRGVFQSNNDTLYRDMVGRQTREDYDNNTKPMLDKVQGQMNEMLDSPALSANYIAEARSAIAQTIKGNEEGRLRRVSAALGLRGLDPKSPSGSILAARAALEADSELANSLRDFGMKAEEIEQSSKMAELSMASQLTTTRMAANNVALTGNADALIGLNQNVSSILEAIRTQRENEALQRQLLRDQAKQDNKAMYIQAGTSLIGSGMEGIGAAGGMAAFF